MHPTIVVSKEPKSKLMTEEIFGPILTVLVLGGNSNSRYMCTKIVIGARY